MYDEDTLEKMAALPGARPALVSDEEMAARKVHKALTLQPGTGIPLLPGMSKEVTNLLHGSFHMGRPQDALAQSMSPDAVIPSVELPVRGPAGSPVIAALLLVALVAVFVATPIIITYVWARSSFQHEAVKNDAAAYVDGEFKWK